MTLTAWLEKDHTHEEGKMTASLSACEGEFEAPRDALQNDVVLLHSAFPELANRTFHESVYDLLVPPCMNDCNAQIRAIILNSRRYKSFDGAHCDSEG